MVEQLAVGGTAAEEGGEGELLSEQGAEVRQLRARRGKEGRVAGAGAAGCGLPDGEQPPSGCQTEESPS